MESFLQQYGLAILTVIIVAMLILMATPIGGLIKDNLDAVIDNFVNLAQQGIESGTWPTGTWAGSH